MSCYALLPPESRPLKDPPGLLVPGVHRRPDPAKAAYDDTLADGLKRGHPVQQIIGTLLQTEVADKQARSIKYQMASARLPTAKELADFDFAASPVNEPLIQELATGGLLHDMVWVWVSKFNV